MRRTILFSMAMQASCGDDATAHSPTGSGSSTSSAATGPVETSSASADTTVDASGNDATDVTDGSVGSTTEGSHDSTTSGESSSDSGVSEDPYSLCASAMTEDECESTEIEWTRQFNQPSCQWREVYTLQVTNETECTLVDSNPRCILFFGHLLGCGGPTCGIPAADGETYLRETGATTVELLFYPSDDVCGPVPEAPPEEPNWVGCGDPEHPACECICDLL